ncbi:hypothetical protein ABCR94_08830 [Streptomyces sp. 21So2-11]|uniref:hypothetical protein n=1 Tax=Streptomyces sp. 21So2-11 TaxID=3144408 RepID=UPI00321B03F6
MTEQSYFDELAKALRRSGMPEPEVAATVADLSGHLADSGGTAHEEFGPAREFAARLTGGAGGTGPGDPAAEAESWRWTSDIYADLEMLNQYGGQGWEVERIDRVGMFVSHRVPGAAMRWEYRREVANNATGRADVTERLAPDGWEPCGHWLFLAYFKRPAAASAGPAADLVAPPAPPPKRFFLSGKYRRMLAACVALIAFVAVAVPVHLLVTDADAGDLLSSETVIGAGVGSVAGLAFAVWGIRRDIAKGVRSS